MNLQTLHVFSYTRTDGVGGAFVVADDVEAQNIQLVIRTGARPVIQFKDSWHVGETFDPAELKMQDRAEFNWLVIMNVHVITYSTAIREK